MRRSNTFIYLFLILIILGLIVQNIIMGSVNIPFQELISSLNSSTPSVSSNIIFKIRIPEIVMAISVGIALSLAGLLMQTFFRNPLAGPSVLGLSSGAGLGVALVLMSGVFSSYTDSYGSIITQILGSFLGTGIVLILILALARLVKDKTSLLLIGLMIGYFASAIVASLEMFSDRISLQKFVFWGMGSFSSVTWTQLNFVVVSVLLLSIFVFLIFKILDAYLLGEEYATSMGVNIRFWRVIIIALAGLLTAIVTSFAGPVAFLGLAVPHISRMIFKSSKHSVLIPASILLGALSALLCLLISKMPGFDFRLPINSVTSIIGAPVVIYLVFQQRKMRI